MLGTLQRSSDALDYKSSWAARAAPRACPV